MIRILFILLALVSAVLAYLFDMGWLFIVAGGLLLVSALLVAVNLRSRHRRNRPAKIKRKTSRTETRPISDPGAAPSREELSRAGILEIRAKSATPRVTDEEFAPPETDVGVHAPTDTPGGAHPVETHPVETHPVETHPVGENEWAPEPVADLPGVEPPGDEQVEADPVGAGQVEADPGSEISEVPRTREIPPSRSRSTPQVTPLYEPPEGHSPGPRVDTALKPFLTSLQAALGVHSAAFLRIDEAAARYRLEAIVSRSTWVRPKRSFPFREYFLSRLLPEPTVIQIGSKLTVQDLGYYKTPEKVAQVAVVPVMDDDALDGFLVVDLLEGDPAFSETQQNILADAGRVLARMMRLEPGPAAEPRPLPPRARGPRLRLVEVGRYTPHRNIIGEEMMKARRERRNLALALVYLYDDVNAFAEGHNLTVSDAEQEVIDKLTALTPNGRVEKFGEMGFGVFHYGALEDVALWVEDAHAALNENGAEEAPRLSIGVAMLSDRHQNPDDLQVDAARALREAYETGDSTILVE